MTRFTEAIADHLEKHGITGLQIGGQDITIEQLRERGPERADRAEVFAAAHAGERIRRPKGRTVYTVDGTAEWDTFGYGPPILVRLRKPDGSHVKVACQEAERMILADPEPEP